MSKDIDDILNQWPFDPQSVNVRVLELATREVLQMRFGLNDGKDHTLEEVGQDFEVTRERIRQIEAKALRKLRHPSRSKTLKTFIDSLGYFFCVFN